MEPGCLWDLDANNGTWMLNGNLHKTKTVKQHPEKFTLTTTIIIIISKQQY